MFFFYYLIPINIYEEGTRDYGYVHFTDEGAEPLRDEVTFPKLPW